MPLREILKTALMSLKGNRLRTALALLGIVIGVGAVITMVAVGAGAQAKVAAQIRSLGSGVLLVLPGAATTGGLRSGTGGVTTLVLEDAEAIRRECPAVAEVAASARGVAPVVAGNMNWTTIVQGTSPEILSVRDWRVAAGRFLTAQDVDGATKVAVLGETVAESLFGADDPVGQVVRIKKVPFEVIGVLEKKGLSPHGADQDDVVFVPVTTAQKKILGITYLTSITASAFGPETIPAAEAQIRDLLRQRHRIPTGEEADFTIRNFTEGLRATEESARTLSILLGAIASVSLLVGGIGIMNIMLVSVTERIREIGIRIAIGARPRDVLAQFLTEALVICFFGGIAGIGAGIGATYLLARLAGWDVLITLGAVLLAFGSAAGVGVFFGYFPAWRASRLHPIEALRYE
jgi:putative ABC transport system permease protein